MKAGGEAMPAEDDLTALVEIERLINEAARTQPGSEQVRLSKALGDAIGKAIRRQPQQHIASEEALNNARANVGLAINTVRMALEKAPDAPSLANAINIAEAALHTWRAEAEK